MKRTGILWLALAVVLSVSASYRPTAAPSGKVAPERSE